MNDENKEMTQQEAEQDFKDRVAGIFAEKVPGSYVDEDGFIVVPMRRRKKSSNS